ncbi:hypothetical protein BpHYR1_001675 [Brachionus plicatilis]|uniref:Uncharacterized protein n=1 Tax=Brachionus plicatilis TaxID=10195 RepID=A0A3M7SP41_BRAPC|nr:hypothetical protein BpHYR1_001675 [Brachionus plicatilis]
MFETIKPLENKLPERPNLSRPQSVRSTITAKKEPISNLNALNTKKFLPTLSPLGHYPSIRTKKKSIRQNSNEHPLNSFRDSAFLDLKDDWSKEGCENMFNSVERFLDSQLKREQSCKRRCNEIIKVRNLKNTQKLIANTIKDFDEKINLNLLLKNKEAGAKGNSPSSLSDSANYRALIAEEILRINSKCSRCREKNRRFEEALFDSPLEIQLKGKNLKKSTLPNLSYNIHQTHVASLHSHHHQKPNLNSNRSYCNVQKLATRSDTIKPNSNDKNMFNLIQSKKLLTTKHRA